MCHSQGGDSVFCLDAYGFTFKKKFFFAPEYFRQGKRHSEEASHTETVVHSPLLTDNVLIAHASLHFNMQTLSFLCIFIAWGM